jgi:CheY-like chemotaxis protein
MEHDTIITILIVEDDPAIRYLWKKQLSVMSEIVDIDICVAEDGKEAIEIVNNKHFDIIITDQNMPNVTGMEFITAVKSRLDYTFTIMCSGNVEDKDESKKSGINMYLEKPIPRLNKQFFISIMNVINKYRERDNRSSEIDLHWLKESYDMCDELSPGQKRSLISEMTNVWNDIQQDILKQEKMDSRKFHRLKGLLSYFDDSLMDTSSYFEKQSRDIEQGKSITPISMNKLHTFLKMVRILVTHVDKIKIDYNY